MKCHICDKELSDKEISYNEALESYEPCMYCLEVAFDAAYCQGFHIEDDKYVIIEDAEDDITSFDIPIDHYRAYYGE